MKKIVKFATSIALLFYFAPGVAALPTKVSELIKKSPLSNEEISLWVAPVDGGQPLLEYQATTPRNPASVAKLFTTGTGLLLLGENYRWRSEFYAEGQFEQGVLYGNLYIKTYGNPHFVEEELTDMVIELRNKGINRIEGEIIIDGGYFQPIFDSPHDFDGNGFEPYNAIPTAVNINFRTADLIFDAGSSGVEVTTNPPLFYTKFNNQIKLVKKSKCTSKDFTPHLKVDPSQDLVTLTGQMATACRQQRLKKVFADPGDVLYGHFKKAWELTGGEITEGWYYGAVPETATLIYTAYSKSLAEQISLMNKNSNNVMTRQLFLTLGAELSAPPATVEKSRQIIDAKLTEMGMDTTGLYIDNGAGLSRDVQVSAKQTGELLLLMQDSRVNQYFENSLAVAGVDGTLRKRLRGTPLEGNAIGKTGTLKNAKSVAGYLTAESGIKYAFVMLFEGRHATSGRQLQDDIMLWIYSH